VRKQLVQVDCIAMSVAKGGVEGVSTDELNGDRGSCGDAGVHYSERA